MILDNFKERLKNIKAALFDIDGVFSNNIIIDANCDLLRTLNPKDSYALEYNMSQNALIIGVITRGDSQQIKAKLNSLKITDVYIKSYNKLADYKHFVEKHNLKHSEIMYMGDDVPDYEVMKTVGLPCCPADAAEEIKSVSAYISDRNGGNGCVRDIIEQILRAQNKWVKL